MTERPSSFDQYALVARVVDRSWREKLPPSKKALQRKVFLIQELGGIDTGYKFRFFTYGPYCADLEGDLDLIQFNGGIELTYYRSENRYEITPGKRIDKMFEIGRQYLETNRPAIDNVLETFGNDSVIDQYVISTIAYLRRHLPDVFEDEESFSERVRRLMPKFSEREVSDGIVKVKGFLAKMEGATPTASVRAN